MVKYDLTKGLSVYRHLLSFALPYWKIFVMATIAMAIYGATESGFALYMKPLLDGGFVQKDPEVIRWLPFGILGIFFVRGVTGFLSSYWMAWLGRQVIAELRKRLFDHLLFLPVNFYDATSSGYLLSMFSFNVEQVSQSITSAVNILVRDSITIIFLLILMFYLGGSLAFVLIGVGVLIGLMVALVSRRLRKLSHRLQDSMGDISHVVQEAVDGQQIVKMFDGQEHERNQFRRVNEGNLGTHMKIQMVSSLNVPVVQFIAAIALAIIVYVATRADHHSDLSPGDFVSLLSAMMLLFPPLKRLTTVNTVMQRGIAAGQSIFEMLNRDLEVDEGEVRMGRATGGVEYRDLTFSYPGRNEPALKNISVTIAPGTKVALVGRSGSGKSTFVKLLSRFYEISQGDILVDGHSIRSIRLTDLRANLASVSQDIVLFNDTLANNIAYGRFEDANQSMIESAAQSAYAAEFIEQLPEGYQTQVGENGVLLSGGQKQRIAIARAILKNAPILLLDEATSALDTELERQIQNALEELMKNRTSFVIAHRLSTIENANLILVFQQGEIVEQGTHQALMAKNGYYANLHRLQFKS